MVVMSARTEFLDAIVEYDLMCAIVEYEDREITLKMGYTPEEYEKFLKRLEFNYDNGFGTQELYGTIWLSNGDWISREEYDGSEWWEYNTCPEIPNELY